MRMIDIIKQAISLIKRFGPAFGGALEFAQKAIETSNNVKSVVPDFPVQEKIEEITKNQGYARSLVQLAAIASTYNAARGILHVTIYGILV
jgi:hypothetical protein